MRTPADKTVVFRFGSHPTKDLKMRWSACVAFPPGAGADTMIPISVSDGEGVPVARATFEFMGRMLPVCDGKASIRYADFIAGKHSVPLWMHRDGMDSIPGGLTFE